MYPAQSVKGSRAPKDPLTEGCSLRSWYPGTSASLENGRFPPILPSHMQMRAQGLAGFEGLWVQGTSRATQARDLNFSML